MYIEIGFTQEELTRYDLQNKIVVAIDVLRATSTITTALENGAESIISLTEIEKALFLKKELPNALLCGERDGQKIPGFDKGNSPLEYSGEVKGKTLLFSSTNGSRTIDKAGNAKKLYMGALINAKALADQLLSEGENSEFFFACSGKLIEPCIEDTLCAGYLVYLLLQKDNKIILSDAAVMARDLFLFHQQNIYAAVATSEHGQYLTEVNFSADVEYCSRLDISTTIPVYDKFEKKIVKFSK